MDETHADGPVDIFADLTDAQRSAVEHTEGPLLVLAAAGSGKTRVITRRIANLIARGVPPWNILALTFTNKAAREMRERIHALLAHDERLTRGLTITTFHSLCARLLRRYADRAGLATDFTIYDTADQLALMKRTITEIGFSSSNFPPRSVLSIISSAKNELKDADAFAADAIDFFSTRIARIFQAYEVNLERAGAVDFDDLLVRTAKMLRTDDQVRAEVQARWPYLLIDEYQDTNHAQFVIAGLIAGNGRPLPGVEGERLPPNICVVGDPDQSIYAWRGADITNILEFERRYPAARVIHLGENFRSTAPILAVADSLIRRNIQRKHKDLIAFRKGGDPVTVEYCLDEHDEARRTCEFFQNLHAKGVPYREMAVFYRTNALSRVIEDALRARSIPYTIARGTAFYEREEIKNAIAYLRVVANPADGVSLLRIINIPPRGIGRTTLAHIERFARHERITLFDALRRCDEVPGVTPRSAAAVARFVALIDTLTASGSFMGAELTDSLADLVERTIRESGLEKHYAAQADATKNEIDTQRLENLAELVSSAAEFEETYDPENDPTHFPGPDALARGTPAAVPPLLAMLRAYLESIALVADADTIDPAQGAVTLMTLHASKGLEFDAVAIHGLEERLLPHARALDSTESLEEERRLCFVGITRARTHLRLSCARTRAVRGFAERTIPSRFLDELDRDHITCLDRTPALDEYTDEVPSAVSTVPPPSRDEGGVPMLTLRARNALTHEYPPGCRVRHPHFGVGTVLGVMGGSMARVRVRFRQAGEKTLVIEHARLTRLDTPA